MVFVRCAWFPYKEYHRNISYTNLVRRQALWFEALSSVPLLALSVFLPKTPVQRLVVSPLDDHLSDALPTKSLASNKALTFETGDEVAD